MQNTTTIKLKVLFSIYALVGLPSCKIEELTISNKDDVTAALVTPPVLMFARTGAPNPIEESWRLKTSTSISCRN